MRSTPRRAGQTKAPDTVSPQWLLKAFLASVAVAIVCGYLTFCALFFQGQWQLVLHPVQPGPALPSRIGSAALQPVHFDVGSSGRPELSGFWLPAAPGDRYRHLAVLFLPDGNGSLAAGALPRLADLRQVGLSVFAFDYRGYGASAPGHPSQRSMESDSEAALAYVVASHLVAPDHVILYGQGIGGYLAARLAARHPEIPAVILDAPRFDIADRVRQDPRVRLLPVRLLLRDEFSLSPILTVLHTPKLILSRSKDESPEFHQAADPKLTAALPGPDQAAYERTLGRFLDAYGPPTPPSAMMPEKAP